MKRKKSWNKRKSIKANRRMKRLNVKARKSVH